MTKRTAEFAVAAVGLVWWQNRQCSLPQEGSGYVPADFQAEKTKIVAPGPVPVEGRRNGLHRRLIRRLLMAAKASRRFVSLLIHQYSYGGHFSVSERRNRSRQTFRCPRAALRRTWRGSLEPALKTGPPPPFGSKWTPANNTSKSALNRPQKDLK
jgi:hypothetical protein